MREQTMTTRKLQAVLRREKAFLKLMDGFCPGVAAAARDTARKKIRRIKEELERRGIRAERS